MLNGGGGKDTFVFHSPTEGGDTIQSFVVENDTIQISASGFGGEPSSGSEAYRRCHFHRRCGTDGANDRRDVPLQHRVVTTCCGTPMDRARAVRCRSPTLIALLSSKLTTSTSWPEQKHQQLERYLLLWFGNTTRRAARKLDV